MDLSQLFLLTYDKDDNQKPYWYLKESMLTLLHRVQVYRLWWASKRLPNFSSIVVKKQIQKCYLPIFTQDLTSNVIQLYWTSEVTLSMDAELSDTSSYFVLLFVPIFVFFWSIVRNHSKIFLYFCSLFPYFYIPICRILCGTGWVTHAAILPPFCPVNLAPPPRHPVHHALCNTL